MPSDRDAARERRDDLVPFTTAVRAWFEFRSRRSAASGQIAVMHRTLVDELRWVGERRFLHALNYCMLLPGPEPQQLAIYLGWLLFRRKWSVLSTLGLCALIGGSLHLIGAALS